MVVIYGFFWWVGCIRMYYRVFVVDNDEDLWNICYFDLLVVCEWVWYGGLE